MKTVLITLVALWMLIAWAATIDTGNQWGWRLTVAELVLWPMAAAIVVLVLTVVLP